MRLNVIALTILVTGYEDVAAVKSYGVMLIKPKLNRLHVKSGEHSHCESL